MRVVHPNFDWQVFWILQVVFLGVPTLVTVIAFRGGDTLSPRQDEVLAFVLIGLTLVNFIFGQLRATLANRFRRP